MEAWNAPSLPTIAGGGQPVTIRDTRGSSIEAQANPTLYVCGITPYDATHLGHAFTYVAFDLLIRAWRDQGLSVTYAQNITDIDDPLFERAEATDTDWRELADSQIELFRSDMEALGVIPPNHWVAVSEILPELENLAEDFVSRGITYTIADGERHDLYVKVSDEDVQAPHLSNLDLEGLLRETGEDPQRPGKQGHYDAMIWKGVLGTDYQAEGDKPGAWRPGWHIECAYIASLLGNVTMTGGGSDLIFPHHEMTMVHLREMGVEVEGHMTAGIVSYKGEKMSKSLGNLVRVSRIIDRGYEAMVVRLLLINHHWSENWEFTADDIVEAERRLTRWRRAKHGGGSGAQELLATVRGYMADNLNTPAALQAIDEWVAGEGSVPDEDGANLFADMCASLLGVYL